MKKCLAHCSGCGSHFRSQGAFDAHRSGPFSGDRQCWAEDNKNIDKLRITTKDGLCAVYEPPSFPVTIWEDAEGVAKARAYFSTPRASAAEHSPLAGLIAEGDGLRYEHCLRADHWAQFEAMKAEARRAVTNALRRGDLVRPAVCDSCGGECTAQAHHTQYSKPLEIDWYCAACHGALHRDYFYMVEGSTGEMFWAHVDERPVIEQKLRDQNDRRMEQAA